MSSICVFTLNRPMDMVDSIASESEHILRRLPDPRRTSFTGKGLVIGYVQSGKTANFTAVAARAVDAGYRLVIVLSGIHNNLRAQTQRRLDRELSGHLTDSEVGVSRPPQGSGWIRLTDRGDYGDFTNSTDTTILESSQPVIAVVKKICPVLESLFQWIQNADPQTLAGCPVLIIDDEADLASVNTGQDRPDEEPDDPDDEASPSRTNELIRNIVSYLPRVSYLAYTATPFANVLIDPQSTDREAGSDLFPSDFIWQLPRPEAYTGTRELFGCIEHESRDVIRFIPDDDMPSIRPPRPRDRTGWHPEISQSVVDAIDEFFIAGAVRAHRGQADAHHTMLVHTIHYTDCQERIAGCVSRYLDGLRGDLEFGGGLIGRLRQIWDSDYHQSLDDSDSISFDDIQTHIPELVNAVKVLV